MATKAPKKHVTTSTRRAAAEKQPPLPVPPLESRAGLNRRIPIGWEGGRAR